MPDELTKERTLPHNLEAERSVLGAILLDNQAFHGAGEVLTSQDFYGEGHRAIFEAMVRLAERSIAIDAVTVSEELERLGKAERAGGPAYLASLVDGLPRGPNVGHYARIVKDKASLRSLIASANAMISQALAGEEDTDAIIDDAERAIFEIAEGKVKRGFLSIHDLVPHAMQELEDLHERSEFITGVPTGFQRLDMLTAGFQPGDLIIIAGRPSMGKCLAHDSEVVLEDGSVVTIEEVVRRRTGTLPTLHENMRLGWAAPSAFVDDGVKPAFEVRTRLGRRVTTTLTHPFLTITGWKGLGELRVGDKVAVPRRLDAFGTGKLRECEVKLLAYLIGDGGLTGRCPQFTNTNPRIAADFAQAIEEFGGLSLSRSSMRPGEAPSWRVVAARDEVRQARARFARRLSGAIAERGVAARAVAAQVGVSPSTVANWQYGKTSPAPAHTRVLCEALEVTPEWLCPDGIDRLRTNQPNPLTRWLDSLGLMGHGANSKEIPSVVFTLCREQLALFLNRLFATDGWASVLASGQTQLGYATVSERLARQVQHLLLRFGVIASLRRRRIRYQGGFRVCWQLDITDAHAIRTFADEIGTFGKEEGLEAAVRAVDARRYHTNRDLIPIGIWERIAEARGNATWREVARRAGIPSSNIHVGVRAPTRDRLGRLAKGVGSRTLEELANSDVYWDEIVSIEAVGPRQVYDLTIPETHNFVANDICVHNTALALNIAQHVAVRHGGAVGIFSLEMSTQQLVRRLMASEAQVDAHKLASGYLAEKDINALLNALQILAEAKIFIDDTANPSLLEMRSKARRLKAEHGLDLLIVDYLQLMEAGGRYDNRNLEIGAISRALKGLAKELSVPVVALSQLSRAPESRSEHRPQLSDLRECVTGDTLVHLSDGRRVPIVELVGTRPEVVAMSSQGKMITAHSEEVWPVGVREVFSVRLASGRKVRATSEHRLYGADGWTTVAELGPGDRVAIPRRLPESPTPEQWVGTTGANLGNDELRADTNGDLSWDRVVSIEPAGEEEVYDLTVPGPASWVGDSIVQHNSGNLEQDADVVAFIFREEVYNPDPALQGLADLIIAKQRNGPTGVVQLAFLKQYTSFKDRAERDEEPW